METDEILKKGATQKLGETNLFKSEGFETVHTIRALENGRFTVSEISFKSSHQRCSIRRTIFRNFAIFTGKHLCWSLFLIKLQIFRPLHLF